MLGLIKNIIGKFNGYSGCLRCGDSWYWKKPHMIIIPENHSGMFPCCEECWKIMDKTEKHHYIQLLASKWEESGPLSNDTLQRLSATHNFVTSEEN